MSIHTGDATHTIVYRSDHCREIHAGFCVPQYGIAAAGQVGNQELRGGIRRTGRVQWLRLCAGDGREVHLLGCLQTALVVGAEVFSRILDWKDRGTCVLFGDGAGAVVVEASATPGILSSVLHTDGQYNKILSVPGQVSCGKVVGSPFLQMDGQAVFKFAVKVLGDVAVEAACAAGISTDEIDWVIPHQANIRIHQATTRRLGMAMEKMVVTVDRHGNTSAASVPMAFDVAMRDGRIRAGQNVLLEGVGGGFTWGAVLLKL